MKKGKAKQLSLTVLHVKQMASVRKNHSFWDGETIKMSLFAWIPFDLLLSYALRFAV